SNVMVTPEGRVKVLDFGLAQRLRSHAADDATRSATELTKPGETAGTLHFMAPETLRGQAADARSDLWSMGVVLHQMVSGELPFQGATGFELTSAILKEPARQLPAKTPSGIRSVIQRCLEKQPGERYQRASEVRAALEAIGPESASASVSASATAAAVAVSPPRRVGWKWPAVAALAIVAAVVAAGILSRKAPSSRIEALAVLPLENLSRDPAQDYFADGMTEELITGLARLGNLRVISRSGVTVYRGTRKPLAEIARELKVDAVVEGSVLRAGDRVRITAQLIEPSTGRSLWAERYERDLRDVLSLQHEVAQAIAREIGGKVTAPVPAAQPGRVRPEAYDAYLRGRALVMRRNRADNEAAIAVLRQAVEIDPAFASGHAFLAVAYAWQFGFYEPGKRSLQEDAARAVDRALALDPNSADAHLARGRLLWTPPYGFQHGEAIREFKLAIRLNASLEEAYQQLATVFTHTGLADEAVAEARRAVMVSPSYSHGVFALGEALMFAGKHEEGLATLKSVPPNFFRPLVATHSSWALQQMGRLDLASARIAAFTAESPDDTPVLPRAIEALVAASAGDARKAEERIRAVESIWQAYQFSHHAAYNVASAYALMNRTDAAMKWLETASTTGFPSYSLFERDRNLANLRKDSRFVALVERLRSDAARYREIQ
ncbi:MAG: protein kinase domain-containing protein, partial [Bryobacteraceae bacterium]